MSEQGAQAQRSPLRFDLYNPETTDWGDVDEECSRTVDFLLNMTILERLQALEGWYVRAMAQIGQPDAERSLCALLRLVFPDGRATA